MPNIYENATPVKRLPMESKGSSLYQGTLTILSSARTHSTQPV
jgi:hypothetical protein